MPATGEATFSRLKGPIGHSRKANRALFFQPPAKLLRQVPVALFQIRQKGGASFGRACLAHDAVTVKGRLLGRWRLSGAVRRQFSRAERAEMVQMSVQRASQGRPLVDQAHSRMTPTVDSPRMAFGRPKPAFQIQIVSRQFIDRPQKQPRQKTGHQFRQMLGERALLLRELLAEFFKLAATVLLRALRRIERIRHGLEFLHLRPQFVLDLLDGLQPALDATR